MLQRSYIILIVGAILLISGIVISALWARSFAGTVIRENTILSGVSIRPAKCHGVTPNTKLAPLRLYRLRIQIIIKDYF